MGRPSKGWTLRKRRGRPYSVRWTLDGEETELGLGTHDRGEAERAARGAYALAVQGAIPRQRVQQRASTSGGPRTEEVGREWLASSKGALHERTRRLYRTHLSTLATAFPGLLDVTTESVEEYQLARLAKVLATTVRKELATLRGLLRFAYLRGHIAIVPEVRTIPRAKGTRFEKRRRVAADEISPEEVKRLLAELPLWSTSKKVPPFPIRARFIVAYETGLRPSTLDVLSVPQHYAKGQTYLRIFDEDDKTRDGRVVPLTPAARRALDKVLPKDGGIVFGKHDYREHITAAAKAALGEDRGYRFTAAHLRSARITHLLELTGNVPGVQRLVGHRQLSTTSRYLRASDRAAAEVVRAASSRKRRS